VTALGPALGFFIGVICGLAVLLLIRTARASRATLKTTVAEISQLLAIPTFSFGGPWVTSTLLRGANLDAILPSYTVSLSLSFAIVAGFPLFTLIVVTCGEWRRGGRPS
jgi:hypothetical protein